MSSLIFESPIFAAVLIVAFASFTQTVLGFGFGVVSTPVLILAGFTLPQTILITGVLSTFQCVGASYSLRESIPWKDVRFSIGVRLLAFPIGILALVVIVDLPLAQIKQVIGLAILLALSVKTVFRIRPREHIPQVASIMAFAASGIMAGAVGIGGPPLVLWTMAKKWSSRQTRGFTLAVFAISTPITAGWVAIQFYEQMFHLLDVVLWSIPSLYLGSWLGFKSAERLSIERLRAATSFVLVLMALNFILAPYF